jgi:ribosomal-protein-alanine N-acetyltransferase
MLDTDRFEIRPYQDADFSFMYAMNRDPEVMKYIREPVTEEAPVRERIEQMKAYRLQFPSLGTFTVILKENGDLIGNLVVRHADYRPDRELEIGYFVAKEYWGKGVGTELVEAACRYVFRQLEATEVVAFTEETNIASNRVLEKNGFSVVGRETIYDGDLLKWRRSSSYERS